MGFSPKHAITVPLVLNPQTGYITAQFHVVFDDWFATVTADPDALPNFAAESWKRMFKDSTYQYILDDEDEARLIVETDEFDRSQNALLQQQQIATAIEEATPPQALPVEPPPMATAPPSTPTPPTIATPLATPRESPLLTPRESPAPREEPIDVSTPAPLQQSTPAPIQLFPSPPPSPAAVEPVREQVTVVSEPPRQRQAAPIVAGPPRRSARSNRQVPSRLGYDGQQGRGYMAEIDDDHDVDFLEWFYNELAFH